jgi:DNA-binding beta-propeller fold protein YncE
MLSDIGVQDNLGWKDKVYGPRAPHPSGRRGTPLVHDSFGAETRTTSGVLEMPKDALLSSPGQLVVDNERGRVLVADTDHHRVVILDFSGQVQHVIGTGAKGG